MLILMLMLALVPVGGGKWEEVIDALRKLMPAVGARARASASASLSRELIIICATRRGDALSRGEPEEPVSIEHE